MIELTDMATSLNRALQVRVADRLRASLGRHVASGLPDLTSLTDVEQREIRDIGGGRLGVLVLRVDAASAQEISLRLRDGIRRTDLFGALADDTLLVLAPGLTPEDGDVLVIRLRGLLDDLPARIGVTYHSSASDNLANPITLVAEAQALVA